MSNMEELDEDQDCLTKGSQECVEIMCEPCSESDIVKADGYCLECKEFLCKLCIKSHKRMKMSRDHHIQGPDEMPKTKPSIGIKQHIPSLQNELNIECKQHNGEVIKYFCKIHKVVGCMDCITLIHRSCADIIRAEEASIDASVVTELEEFDRRLNAVGEGFQNIVQMAEQNHLQAEDQKERLLLEIRQYKETIVETLDNLSKKIETQLSNTIKEDRIKIDQLMKRCKTLQEDVAITSSELNCLKEGNQNTKKFILMNQSQLQLNEWEKDWNDMVANFKPNQYAFCPDLNLRRAMKEVSELGQLVKNVETAQCGVCKTTVVRSHMHMLCCGHGSCDVCTDGSGGKDRKCPTCGKVTVPCYTCQKDFDKNNTKTLACGHQHVCRECSEKQACITCQTCGVITVCCKRCKAAVDKSSISPLACGHDVCLSCRKQQTGNEAPCTDCGLVTGNQPTGTIQERTEKEYGNTIRVLEFNFPDGKQEPYHPNPGKVYKGCKLICRLDTWLLGPKVYIMLKKAFENKLVCKIEQDKIVSNIELYHDSVMNDRRVVFGVRGMGVTYNYNSYVSRVMKRLKELGISD